MAIVPEMVERIIAEHRQAIEAWFSAQLYRNLVAQHPEHVLVRLAQRLDFGPLVAGCQGYPHMSGPGAKPTHTLARLVRSLTVKYLYDWSLRETEDHLQSNLLLRWFVGYGIVEAVLDHSTLERFEQWVRAQQPRLFFDTILQQIEQALPELRAGPQVQIGDSYACQANAANEGTLGLLRHTSRLLLAALAQAAPQVHAALLQRLDSQALFGPSDERNYHFLPADERLQRQATTARGAWQLCQGVRPVLADLPQPVQAQVQTWVANLDKILADEFQLTEDADGSGCQVVERAAQDKGSYRIISATDPEATIRHHGRRSTLGYNVSLAIHPNGLICEIQAATGSEPDANGLLALIQVQKDQRDQVVDKMIFDQAAGSGRTRAQVEQLNAGQTQLVAGIPPVAVTGCFGPDDFHFQAEGVLRCPAERTTTTKHRATGRAAWSYTFSAKVCRACPLWAQCHQKTAKPNGSRRVFISDYQDQIRRAQAYNQTEAFKQDMRLRSRVERVIFMLTHYDGARRARARGLRAADFQAKMCATVRNLRTWLKLLDLHVVRKPQAAMAMA